MTWGKAWLRAGVGWAWEMPPSSPAKGEFQVCVRTEGTVGWRKGMRKHLASSWRRNISGLVHTGAGREGVSSFLTRGYVLSGESRVLFSKCLGRVEWVLWLFHSCSWASRAYTCFLSRKGMWSDFSLVSDARPAFNSSQHSDWYPAWNKSVFLGFPYGLM